MFSYEPENKIENRFDKFKNETLPRLITAAINGKDLKTIQSENPEVATLFKIAGIDPLNGFSQAGREKQLAQLARFADRVGNNELLLTACTGLLQKELAAGFATLSEIDDIPRIQRRALENSVRYKRGWQLEFSKLAMEEVLNRIDSNTLTADKRSAYEIFPRSTLWENTPGIVKEAPLAFLGGLTGFGLKAILTQGLRFAVGRFVASEAIAEGTALTLGDLATIGGARIDQAGKAIKVAGTLGGAASFGVGGETFFSSINGELLFKQPDWVQRVLWNASSLGVFKVAGKVGGVLSKELPGINKILGKINNPDVKELAEQLSTKGATGALGLLLLESAQRGVYGGDVTDLFHYFGEDLLRAYIFNGSLALSGALVKGATQALISSSFEAQPTHGPLRLYRHKDSGWIVLGEGFVGGKAENLMRFAKEIEASAQGTEFEAGLGSGTVVTEGALTTIFNAPRDKFRYPYRGGFKNDQPLNEEALNQLVQAVIKSLPKDHPGYVYVRSSAAGDEAGTGVYTSFLCEATPEAIGKALKRVANSYFTQSAKDFRRDAKTGQGFGILIQPLVGNSLTSEFSGNIFGPLLSGQGFAGLHKGNELTLVPGLGGGVDGGGVKIKESKLKGIRTVEEFTERYEDYLYESGSIEGLRGRGISGRAGYYESNRVRYGETQGVYLLPEQKMTFRDTVENGVTNQIRAISLVDIFTYLRNLYGKTSRIGNEGDKKLFIEFAVSTDSDGKRRISVLQVAPSIEENSKSIVSAIANVKDDQKAIKGVTLVGNGIKPISKVVIINDPDLLPVLKEFNKNNSNYLLVISSSVVSTYGSSFGKELLKYEHYSNARAIVEWGINLRSMFGHSEDPRNHFDGLQSSTGKVFLATEANALQIMNNLKKQPGLIWNESSGLLVFSPLKRSDGSSNSISVAADMLSGEAFVWVDAPKSH